MPVVQSDNSCRAGKQCKWLHTWEGITDKNARCWNCGSKMHRKHECPVKGGGAKSKDEPKGSGEEVHPMSTTRLLGNYFQYHFNTCFNTIHYDSIQAQDQ